MSLRDRLHLPSAEGKGRFAVTAIGAAAIFGAIFIMAGNSAERKAKEDEEKAMSDVTHILTDSDTRSLGLDSLAARIQSQEREIRDLRTELAKRRTEALPAVSTDPAVSAGMEELRGELESLREGQSIPKELFVIIAEILSYSYLLQGKFPEHWKRKDGTDAINMKA